MKRISIGCGTLALTLAACTIQTQPAVPGDVAVGRQAASICSKYATQYSALGSEFAAIGFTETEQSLAAASAFTKEYENVSAGAQVAISRQGKETACIVALNGLMPEQTLALAQPWVDAYNAKTNAERGQGLSKKVVQAWANFDDTRNIYISAYKEWRPLDAPGAAIRLIYFTK